MDAPLEATRLGAESPKPDPPTRAPGEPASTVAVTGRSRTGPWPGLVAHHPSVEECLHRLVDAVGDLLPLTHAALVVSAPGAVGSRLLVPAGLETSAAEVRVALDAHGVHLPPPARAGVAEDTAPHSDASSNLRTWELTTGSGLRGCLHLLRPAGSCFSAVEVRLVQELLDLAVIAVDNAVEAAKYQLRQQWIEAARKVSQELLGCHDDERRLWRLIARHVRRLTEARTVTICIPSPSRPDQMLVAAAAGVGADQLVGHEYPLPGSLAEKTMQLGRGQQVDASDDLYVVQARPEVKLGQVLGLPLMGERGPRGVVVVSRPADGEPFGPAHLELAEDFARQATIALEMVEAKTAQRSVEATEERDRIARDLYDSVIQRLFVGGLRLQGIASVTESTPVRLELLRTIAELDDVITQIRTSVFALKQYNIDVRTVRTVAVDAVDELEPALGLRPHLLFTGPVDELTGTELADDLEAVLVETLTALATEVAAEAVQIDLRATDQLLTLDLRGQGRAVSLPVWNAHLVETQRRAAEWRGAFSVRQDEAGAFALRWEVPL